MATTTNRTALIEGILLLVLSFVGLGEGIRLVLDVDPHAVPDTLGPGYYIVLVSVLLVVTSITHLVKNLRREDVGAVVEAVVDKELRWRVVCMILAMILYIVLLDIFGYAISTVVFFLMQFRIVGITSWPQNIALTALATVLFYVLFVVYCEMSFPPGIFG